MKCKCYLNVKAAKNASKGTHGGYICPIHDANTFLLATFPSLEAAQKGIGEYLYSPSTTLESITDKTWSVNNGKGRLEGFIVIKKGKRYRFEQFNNISH
jgi:hypothetical protein